MLLIYSCLCSKQKRHVGYNFDNNGVQATEMILTVDEKCNETVCQLQQNANIPAFVEGEEAPPVSVENWVLLMDGAKT